ncbi:MAG TPA: hypothetical protein VMP08_10355 [Anaerolineae bacterium]|nr:hypothetical protein [Anaerolineae bacterium]
MSDHGLPVGRVLRSSTASFTIGTKTLATDVPRFGGFVKATVLDCCDVIGLIYDVLLEDDLFARQLIGAEVDAEYIADQRQNRQMPIEVSVLVVGFAEDGRMHQYLPSQPPITLDEIVTCNRDEIIQFTNDFTYFRTVLNAKDAPADELLAASLRLAAEARGSQGREFLVKAGRELSRLLAFDAVRLEGLLRRIKP